LVDARTRATLANTADLANIVTRQIPEFGADGAMKFCAAALLSAGALWTHTNPSAAMLAAYEQHPDLAAARLDFTENLTELLTVLVRGCSRRPDERLGSTQRSGRCDGGVGFPGVIESSEHVGQAHIRSHRCRRSPRRRCGVLVLAVDEESAESHFASPPTTMPSTRPWSSTSSPPNCTSLPSR
jgi:hypothetical protein